MHNTIVWIIQHPGRIIYPWNNGSHSIWIHLLPFNVDSKCPLNLVLGSAMMFQTRCTFFYCCLYFCNTCIDSCIVVCIAVCIVVRIAVWSVCVAHCCIIVVCPYWLILLCNLLVNIIVLCNTVRHVGWYHCLVRVHPVSLMWWFLS